MSRRPLTAEQRAEYDAGTARLRRAWSAHYRREPYIKAYHAARTAAHHQFMAAMDALDAAHPLRAKDPVWELGLAAASAVQLYREAVAAQDLDAALSRLDPMRQAEARSRWPWYGERKKGPTIIARYEPE